MRSTPNCPLRVMALAIAEFSHPDTLCQGVGCAWFEVRSWPEYTQDADGKRTYHAPVEGSCGLNRLTAVFQCDVPPGYLVD